MRTTLFQTFGIPVALLAITIVGLIIGVVADGWWDALAVVALAAPLLAISACLFLRPRQASKGGSRAERRFALVRTRSQEPEG